jgi:hypothetical protein
MMHMEPTSLGVDPERRMVFARMIRCPDRSNSQAVWYMFFFMEIPFLWVIQKNFFFDAGLISEGGDEDLCQAGIGLEKSGNTKAGLDFGRGIGFVENKDMIRGRAEPCGFFQFQGNGSCNGRFIHDLPQAQAGIF